MTGPTNFDNLTEAVGSLAEDYEDALDILSNQADSSTTGTMSISQATKATTEVQIAQSLTEMASGIAKNAADQVKKQGTKISQ